MNSIKRVLASFIKNVLIAIEYTELMIENISVARAIAGIGKI